MKSITTLFFYLLVTNSFAQTKELSTLPFYDCSLKKVMAIIGRPTIIASPDNSKGLDVIIADYCGTFGSNCIRKKESELDANDYARDILMVGILKDFKNWARLKTPITLSANGFIINNRIFRDKADGFVFVDTNRIIIGGNSLKAVKTPN